MDQVGEDGISRLDSSLMSHWAMQVIIIIIIIIIIEFKDC